MTIEEISRSSGVPKSTVQRILSAEDPHCSLVYIVAIIRAMGGSIWLSHDYSDDGSINPSPNHEAVAEAILSDYGDAV